jgi:hypothetical protein
MHISLRPVAALLFTASLAAPATGLPITIDNFESGIFTVVDTSIPATPTQAEQSGLAATDVVGGVRLVRATASGTLGVGTAALVTTGGDDGALLTTAGPPAAMTDFNFIYDGIANGLSDGSSGTLGIDLTSATPAITVDVSSPGAMVAFLRVQMWDGVTSRTSAFQAITVGANQLLLTGTMLQLNLADIRAIMVTVADVNAGDVPTILNIAAVPEPGTAFLMALGLIGLGIQRARSPR